MPKVSQRKIILDKLHKTPADQFTQGGRQAADNLVRTPEYQQAKSIMLFISMHNEIDTSSLIDSAFADQKTVIVPKVVWDVRKLIPLVLDRPDAPIHHDHYGLSNPINEIHFPLDEIDLVIVPGLAFDPYGNRLGRGGGFYDRFFETPDFHTIRCGFGLEYQFVPTVPIHDHDVPVHLLVTDNTIRRFKNQPGPSSLTYYI